MKWFMLAAMFAFTTTVTAEDKKDDKKPTESVTLTLVAKTDKYKFDGGGKMPAEYKKDLEDAAKIQESGKAARPPKSPTVDLVLVLTNTSKEDVTLYLGGDANVYSFELTGGAGSATLKSERAFTADLKLPKATTLAAGKTHEIPVTELTDGFRGAGRHVYWVGPGDYKLAARFVLSTKDGGKGTELRSEPVKITVTEK